MIERSEVEEVVYFTTNCNVMWKNVMCNRKTIQFTINL